MASDQEVSTSGGETAQDGNEVRDRREREAAEARASERDAATSDRESLEDVESLKAKIAQLMADNKKTNSENAAKRRRLEELEAAQRKLEDEKLSGQERLQKERDELSRKLVERERLDAERQEQIKSLTIKHAVEEEARRLNFEYPDLVPAMLPRGEVELDEDGKVIGAKAAVEKLAKDRPGLVTASRGGGTPLREGQGGRRPLNGGGAPQSLEERTKAEFSTTGRYRQF